jgi:putative DNA primase/helicase
MVKLACSEPGVPLSAAVLDQDKFLLNVENGTLELRTGQLRTHAREDYITRAAPVTYDPFYGKIASRGMEGG